jgi:ribose transport system substrate-binding protein
MSRRTLGALALTCIALVVVLAGFGGSSKPAAVAVTASGSSAPESLGSFAPAKGLGGKVPTETIGLVNVQGTSPAAQACQAQLVRAAEVLGWTVKTADAQGDPAKMAADVSAMVTSKVNAIVTVAIEQAQAQQGLAAAKAEHIPALSFCGALTDSPLYQAVYAPNDAAIAATTTQYLIDSLGGKGSVVAQFYPPIGALDRRDTVAMAMLKAAGIKIAATHEVDFTNPVADTISSTTTMLRANPSARAVLVDQDFEFPAAIQAIKQAGLAGKVKVYGMYGGDPAFQALRQGGPAAAISESAPEASGWTVIDQLLKLFVNHKAIDPLAGYNHPYPVTLVTAGNVPSGPEANLFPDVGPLYEAQWKAEGYKY